MMSESEHANDVIEYEFNVYNQEFDRVDTLIFSAIPTFGAFVEQYVLKTFESGLEYKEDDGVWKLRYRYEGHDVMIQDDRALLNLIVLHKYDHPVSNKYTLAVDIFILRSSFPAAILPVANSQPRSHADKRDAMANECRTVLHHLVFDSQFKIPVLEATFDSIEAFVATNDELKSSLASCLQSKRLDVCESSYQGVLEQMERVGARNLEAVTLDCARLTYLGFLWNHMKHLLLPTAAVAPCTYLRQTLFAKSALNASEISKKVEFLLKKRDDQERFWRAVAQYPFLLRVAGHRCFPNILVDRKWLFTRVQNGVILPVCQEIITKYRQSSSRQ